jgi:hypothetical protein
LIAPAITLLIIGGRAVGQSNENSSANPTDPAEKEWIFTASSYVYFVPHSQVYVNPNFTADHHELHLEARYNYEAQETASLWVGYKFSRGEKLVLEVTPMVGAVFGKLKGVAPGYLTSLSYKKFDVSSQGEFVIATERANSFFYTWTELGYSPVEWFRTGVVIQRTKAYQTPFDIQRGLFAGVTYKKMDFVAYFLNLDRSEKTVVTAVVLNF